MSDINSYWKRVVSNGLLYLQKKRLIYAVTAIKNSSLNVEFCWHDNWDGGINYWNLVFRLKNKDFTAIDDRKEKIESEIYDTLKKFDTDDANKLNNVLIQPRNEDCIDWISILPMTKEQTIALINEEQKLLLDVAKCNISFKEEGVEEIYQKRHLKILSIARKAYFDYPEEPNTLADWWNEVKDIPYPDRQEYISKKFSPILKSLRESDDNITDVDFSHIVFKSETVKKAAEEAVTLIRDGLYDSAFDRVHTVFHGYLRQLLKDYNVAYNEDDGLPQLFTMLSKYYGNSIKPAVVAERIKSILRSAGGIIKSVNELRNNNTIVHPNEYLIQKRDAELVIRIVNALLDYIEEIDQEYQQQERLIET